MRPFFEGGHLMRLCDSGSMKNGDIELVYVYHCSGLGNNLLKIGRKLRKYVWPGRILSSQEFLGAYSVPNTDERGFDLIWKKCGD